MNEMNEDKVKSAEQDLNTIRSILEKKNLHNMIMEIMAIGYKGEILLGIVGFIAFIVPYIFVYPDKAFSSLETWQKIVSYVLWGGLVLFRFFGRCFYSRQYAKRSGRSYTGLFKFSLRRFYPVLVSYLLFIGAVLYFLITTGNLNYIPAMIVFGTGLIMNSMFVLVANKEILFQGFFLIGLGILATVFAFLHVFLISALIGIGLILMGGISIMINKRRSEEV